MSRGYSNRPPKPSEKRKQVESLADDVLESVRDHFKRPRPIPSEDRAAVFANNVAIKLRALDRKQILVAEKLINDLLFEAEIGNLTPQHAHINMHDVLRQNHPNYVPPQQYRQQIYHPLSPASTRSYTTGSYVPSASPSPPYSSTSSQHSHHFSQSIQNSSQVQLQNLNSYPLQTQTPIPGNQSDEDASTSSQHSHHFSQSIQNSSQVQLQNLNSYPLQTETPIPGNQSGEDDGRLTMLERSAATYVTNFRAFE